MTLSWLFPTAPTPKPPPDDRNVNGDLLTRFQDRLASIPPPLLALCAFTLGTVTTAAGTHLYTRYFRRIRTGDWITPDTFAKRRWVKGVVTNVGDADNFRLYHTPGIGWRWPLKFRKIPTTNKELRDQTIHIRMAGVDAPEAAHFGRPAQPYAEESLAWLKKQVEGKTVYCQLVRRDQYSRIVAIVVQRPIFLPGVFATGKNISLVMLRAGWVTTYEQAGAEYGSWGKEEFLKAENEAKLLRRGMWKSGTNLETPAEYKRRYAQSADSAEKGGIDKKKGSWNATGWLARFLPWRK